MHYQPTELSGHSKEHRTVIFDLYCIGSNGEHFIIEMQQVSQDFFIDRSIYYTSRLITNVIKKGPTDDKYQLPPIYFIGLLEFTLPDLPKNEYFVDAAICELTSKEIIYSKLGYKFLVIPNFNKKEGEIITDMDKWFYLLKHMSELDSIPKFLDKRVFGRIFDIGRVANLNPEEMNQYEISLKRRLDARSVQATHEGLKKDLKKARHTIAKKDHAIAEKDHAIAEKDHTIAEKDHAIAEKDHTIDTLSQIVEEQSRTNRGIIGYLKNQGHTIKQIMEITNLDSEVIKKVYDKE